MTTLTRDEIEDLVDSAIEQALEKIVSNAIANGRDSVAVSDIEAALGYWDGRGN